MCVTQKLSMLTLVHNIQVVHTEYWCVEFVLGMECAENARDEYGCIPHNLYAYKL
jgi:hypothetical protein